MLNKRLLTNINMSAKLTNEGIVVSINEIRKKFTPIKFKQLLSKLTITTKQKIGPPKIAKLFKYTTVDDERYIHFPRSMLGVFNKHNLLNIKVQLPPKTRIKTTFKGKLDDNQSTILNFLMSNFYFPANIKNGKASTTLQLTAGYGKTFVGIGLISKLQTRTLVVVPANSDLATQWVSCCSEYLDGTATLYNNKKDEIANTTIIMISTAIKKSAKWLRQFGLIIYDEIHMFCSPVWGDIFWRTNVRCVLGLTATPDDRADKFDEVFKRHVGAVLYANSIPGFQANEIPFRGIVDVVEFSGHPDYTVHTTNPATGKLDSGKLVKLLNGDPMRNKLIVKETQRLYELHKDEEEIENGDSHPDKPLSIFIFCTYREHVKTIYNLLRECGIGANAPEIENSDNDNPIKVMMGSMKNDEIEEAKRARITITTFKFSGTGISIVEKTAIIFASPLKSNFKQIVARILRKGSDYSVVRRITDIVDTQTALRHQLRERAKAYNLYDFEMRYRNADYEDFSDD